MSKVIGINRTSDASLCVFEDGELISFFRKERFSREKHAWGALGDLEMYVISSPSLFQEVDAVVECYGEPHRQPTAANTAVSNIEIVPEER